MDSHSSTFLRWFQKKIFFIIFIVFFQVYLKTTCPTIYWEDSSEFVAASDLLGITHPTGYPTYCILGKFMSLLFLGHKAFRINLVSALSAAAGMAIFSCLLTNLFKKLQYHRLNLFLHPGILLSVFYAGFLSPYWSEGVVSEVYSLNIFFFLLLIYLTYIFIETKPDTRFFYFYTFIYGLSISNHMTMGLYLPVFTLLFIYFVFKYKIHYSKLFIATMFGLSGLTPYFYIVMRASTDPMKNWFYLDKFIPFTEHLFATHYSEFYSLSETDVYGKLVQLSGFCTNNFKFYFLILIIPGIILFIKKWLQGFTLLIILFLFNFLFVLYYLYETFFLPAFLVLCCFMGIGILSADILFQKWSNGTGRRIFRVILYFLVIVVLFNQYFSNYYWNTKNDHYWAKIYAHELLYGMSINSFMLTTSDQNFYITEYFQKCENMRLDIKQFHRPAITWPGYMEYRKKLYFSLDIPDQNKISGMAHEIELKQNLAGKKFYNKIRESIIQYLVFKNIDHITVYWEGGQDNDLLPDILIPDGLQFRLGHDPEKLKPVYPSEIFWNPALRGDVPAKEAISMVFYNFGVQYLRTEDLKNVISFLRTAKIINPDLHMSSDLLKILNVSQNNKSTDR
ncbi:MAG: hypothetical protein A2161_22155 [Candidatus Schekmanbacteria bacterium RBG_13_48_7]|uniref:DUF2723 domain-containing protein n=1 Tax=Candidatus Schekmanbacteria bacterium RBG_13_48_7 TaxID=1817878 RepID=A0A1F7RZQ7_9BACT|nr:MAG: hypothetical protein A2161_22155 [Candidatus Schekmanbacteria bacterium RBG_13_48_7]